MSFTVVQRTFHMEIRGSKQWILSSITRESLEVSLWILDTCREVFLPLLLTCREVFLPLRLPSDRL